LLFGLALFFNFHSPAIILYFCLLQVTSAEVQMAAALVENNIPFAAADTFSPLFRKMFPDSENKNNMHSERCNETLFQVYFNLNIA
jgi:hypothetical protein